MNTFGEAGNEKDTYLICGRITAIAVVGMPLFLRLLALAFTLKATRIHRLNTRLK
jgi:hypothetical protein